MVSGIYLITNKINGHMYVGGSINIKRRFKEHQRGADSEQPIDTAILKYGKENFSYQIITELPADWDVISQHEKYWIKFYNTFEDKKHYNLTEGGEKDYILNEQTRKKMSESHKGENNYWYGKKRSEHSKKMSGENHPMWNKTHTPWAREKISKNHADVSGKNNPMYGADRSGKNNPNYGNKKKYPRIIKGGIEYGKQIYKVVYNGKHLFQSVSKERLYERWYNKYPDIELIDETVVD